MSRLASDEESAFPEGAICPYCKAPVGEGIGAKPEPGCIAICSDCRQVAVWDDDMQLKMPSVEDEGRIIEASPLIKKAISILAQMFDPKLN
jgi:hypothetical protein